MIVSGNMNDNNNLSKMNRDISNGITRMYCGSIGQSLFISMGYLCVFFLLLEFAAILIFKKDWCYMIWMGIPVGALLLAGDSMYIFKNKEKIDKTNSDTLYVWLFVGITSGVCGFMTGLSGFFQPCFLTFMALLCSMGSFMTGVMARLRIHVICALIASVLSFVSLLFQGDLWIWQLPTTALVLVFAFIIPGYMFKQLDINI